MKTLVEQLLNNQQLGYEDARQIIYHMADGAMNPAQTSAVLTSYIMRGVSLEELRGFRDALLELCIKPELDATEAIDVCGTGGDGKNTFNISTLSSLVVAGAGYKVVKHGNYGVSSNCGSSDILMALGYNFTDNSTILQKQLEECNICFLHAPMFHPALKHAAPIRKELGIKTFFNMLGPLVNPAQPAYRYTGVFGLGLARMYHYLYQESAKRYAVVHGLDGYDEVSLTSAVKIYSNEGAEMLLPEDFGFAQVQASELAGDAKTIFLEVLRNETTENRRNVVLANAGLAIRCFEAGKDLSECIAIARESLASGKPYQILQKLIAA